MKLRLRSFVFTVITAVIFSFSANAQIDSLVAPKEQARFKNFRIPAVREKDSVMVKQENKKEILNNSLPVASNLAKDSLILQSKAKPGVLRKAILPTALIAGGVLLSSTALEKSIGGGVRDAVGNGFHTKIDDYTRYVPILQMYTADAFGVKAKNHWFDQSKNLAISMIVTDFVVNNLKDNIHKTRPTAAMGTSSFPSAHTAQAFTTATVLYEEFKDSSPLLAYSGYVFATATGAMRMMNNAHWLSDVAVGAGIGILVTKAVYLLDPIIKWNPFLKKDKNKEMTILPQVASNQYGVYVGYRF